jgi:hypothetical protein
MLGTHCLTHNFLWDPYEFQPIKESVLKYVLKSVSLVKRKRYKICGKMIG